MFNLFNKDNKKTVSAFTTTKVEAIKPQQYYVEKKEVAEDLSNWDNELAIEIAKEAKELVEEKASVEAEEKAVVEAEEAKIKKDLSFIKQVEIAEAGLIKANDLLEQAIEKAEKAKANARAKAEETRAKVIEVNTSAALKLAEIRAKRNSRNPLALSKVTAREPISVDIKQEAEANSSSYFIEIGEEVKEPTLEDSLQKQFDDYVFGSNQG